MSSELSELIALGCADLATPANGSSAEIHLMIDAERRLSIKQMTATELTRLRAVAAAEAEALSRAEAEAEAQSRAEAEAEAQSRAEAKAKALSRAEAEAEAQSRAEAEAQSRAEAEAEAQSRAEAEAEAQSRAEAEAEAKARALMMEEQMVLAAVEEDRRRKQAQQNRQGSPSPSPREQQQPLMEPKRKKQVQQSNETSVSPKSTSRERLISLPHDELDRAGLPFPHASAASGDESSSPSQIADTIELLRSQRAARGASSQQRSRGRSPSPLEARNHERSAAPGRQHSSSISSSLSESRRGSTASARSNETAVEPSVPPPPPKFPLTKTVSAPNIIDRRRSSLTNLFPGPSPLMAVAAEPMLHTNPETAPEDADRQIPSGKMVHRTKTPPPVGAKLGVCLKRVTAPSGSITVKPKEGPMLGVVLRKVEKKTEPQKSILDDDKPLYHLSIVRSDNKEYKPTVKPKPKPAAPAPKPSPGGILTGPQVVQRTVNRPAVSLAKPQRPQLGVPITITKIEGDKIIIIKKIIVPKNSKIPEQYLQVGHVIGIDISIYIYR
ncbi:hypothetical protein ACLKA7_005403 [Drosophila subpalustris]